MLSNENMNNSVLYRANTIKKPYHQSKRGTIESLKFSSLKNTSESSASNASPSRKSDITLLRPESVKRANNDSWIAAAIGDLEWLKQSFRFSTEMVLDKNGFAAIHLASIHGRLNILKFLIEDINVDPNFPSLHKWRPIHLCISSKIGKKSVECLNYLIGRGAVVNVANEDGTTPLHMAASEGVEECVKILLSCHADPFAFDFREQKPIDLARLWSHKKCAKMLASAMWHNEKILNLEQTILTKKMRAQEVLLDIEKTISLATNQNEKQKDKILDTWLNEQGFNQQSNNKVEKFDKNKKKSENKTKLPEIGEDNSALDKNMSSRSEKSASKHRSTLSSASEKSEKNFHLLYGVQDLIDEDRLRRDSFDDTLANKKVPRWNISTKLDREPYLKNLEDFYPRDPYTLMPSDVDMMLLHRELNGLSVEEIKDFMKTNIKDKALKAKERLDLIQTRNQRRSLNTEHQRPLYYRPKNILDCETKKRVTENKLGIDEASFALTSDPSSPCYEKSKNYIIERIKQMSLPAVKNATSMNEQDYKEMADLKNFIECYFEPDLYEFMRDKNGKISQKYEKVFIC